MITSQSVQELERLFRAVQTWPLVSVRVGDTSQQQQPPPSAAAPPTPSEQACQLTALSHSAQRQVGASTERLVVVPVPTTVLQVQLGNGPEPPKQKQNKERHDDFYANVGDAIRTLRDDIPDLFRDDLNCAHPSASTPCSKSTRRLHPVEIEAARLGIAHAVC